jgi:hypothetical protein
MHLDVVSFGIAQYDKRLADKKRQLRGGEGAWTRSPATWRLPLQAQLQTIDFKCNFNRPGGGQGRRGGEWDKADAGTIEFQLNFI